MRTKKLKRARVGGFMNKRTSHALIYIYIY